MPGPRRRRVRAHRLVRPAAADRAGQRSAGQEKVTGSRPGRPAGSRIRRARAVRQGSLSAVSHWQGGITAAVPPHAMSEAGRPLRQAAGREPRPAAPTWLSPRADSAGT